MIGPQLQLIKVLPNPSYCYQYSPEPQRRKDDVFICNCYPNPFPHPEIRTSVPGDLHRRTDHLTGDPVRAPPNAGRQHQHHTNSQFRLALSVTPCMPHTSSLEYINSSSSPCYLAPHPPQAQPMSLPLTLPRTSHLPPPPPFPLSPTNSLTSFHNTRSQHEETQPRSPELFSPTPASSTIQNKWPSPPPPPPPPSLNDHHALGEGTRYIIMKVLPQQMEATMCIAVLALPHLTSQHLSGSTAHNCTKMHIPIT